MKGFAVSTPEDTPFPPKWCELVKYLLVVMHSLHT